MPRQLVACAMDGQVGVESTGVCGPVRAEAGDWHTALATRGPVADDLTAVLTLVHLLGNEQGHNNVARWEYTHPLPLCCAAAGNRQRFVKTSQSGNTWWSRICLFFSRC